MFPGNPKILTCPHCRGKKKVLSLESGNTFGAMMWSDNKRVYPNLPSPSFIQKCPHCGGYFLLSRQKKEEYGEDWFCLNQGRLSYEDLKEAFVKLSLLPDLTDDEHTEMLFYLVWAYNDRYNSENPSKRADELPFESESYEEMDPFLSIPIIEKDNQVNLNQEESESNFKSEDAESKDSKVILSDETESSNKIELMVASVEERAFIEGIVLKLLNYVSDPLMKAELYREIGRFDEATEMLKLISSEDDFIIRFKRVMADYIDKKETIAIDLTPLMYVFDED